VITTDSIPQAIKDLYAAYAKARDDCPLDPEAGTRKQKWRHTRTFNLLYDACAKTGIRAEDVMWRLNQDVLDAEGPIRVELYSGD
jgi:hypothetical protein